MRQTISGLHHVTAISGPPQGNVDFYVGTLLQRFVKKTFNFDDPGTYQLYFGNQQSEPIETLGQELKLPAQYENQRDKFERILPPITVPKRKAT